MTHFQRNEKTTPMNKATQNYTEREIQLKSHFRKHLEKESARSKSAHGWTTTLRRFGSGAFGRPFLCIGVLRLISQWGEMGILIIYMITIFRQSKSSIDPDLAPVFVGILQVSKRRRHELLRQRLAYCLIHTIQ